MGDLVCINDKFPSHTLEFYKQYGVSIPRNGKIYQIRGIEHVRGKVGVFLREIQNPEVPIQSMTKVIYKEPSFNISRFTTLLGNPVEFEVNVEEDVDVNGTLIPFEEFELIAYKYKKQ